MWIELALVIVGIVLIEAPRLRNNERSLTIGLALLVLAGLANRFSATLFAQTASEVAAYTPHIAEWLTTIGVIAAALLAWLLAVRYLAVFEPKAHGHKQVKPRRSRKRPEPLRSLSDIHIAAADHHANPLTRYRVAMVVSGGKPQHPGRLHHQLHPRPHEVHRPHQVLVAHRHHVVDVLLHERKRDLPEVRGPRAVGDRLRIVHRVEDPGLERPRCIVAGGRLHADHLAARRHRLRGNRAAAEQTCAAAWHEQIVQLAHVLEQLERGSALACDDVRMIVRRHERVAVLGGQASGNRLPRVFGRIVDDDLGAVVTASRPASSRVRPAASRW